MMAFEASLVLISARSSKFSHLEEVGHRVFVPRRIAFDVRIQDNVLQALAFGGAVLILAVNAFEVDLVAQLLFLDSIGALLFSGWLVHRPTHEKLLALRNSGTGKTHTASDWA
jgi:hypothetical protein